MKTASNPSDILADTTNFLPFNLSLREFEIAEIIAYDDLTNQEIGDKLFISKYTVDTHMQNIRKKTGAKRKVGVTMKIREALKLKEWK